MTAASLLFSLQASPANAANPKKPAAQTPDEARADAEKRLEEGLQRYAKGDYEGARLAFAQAYAVLTSIDLLYNLMRSEVKSGHPLEALVHIHQMLRDPKATTEDARSGAPPRGGEQRRFRARRDRSPRRGGRR